VGISGSVTVGDGVILGGQVGVADHVSIGAGARLAAKSGVSGSLAAGGTYGGLPAQEIGQWRREVVTLRNLTRADKAKTRP
jgi:UDP-3-O-[3-hydroxymyristoyl] glucosamine N-acyltransferase